jgi:hypothetical protein
MKTKICHLTLLLATTLSAIQPALAQQKGDPLTGTWKGDWGPSPTDRNAVILQLKWNGKTLAGTINPGADAIPIDKGSFDPQSRKIRFEATKTAPNFVYVIDGTVENDKMTGTWSRPNRKGDFQVTREVKKKAELDAAPDTPKLPGLKGDEERIVQYLLKDWGTDYSITSVDTAIDALGLRQSDQERFRIGKYIKDHPELHSVIRQWGWQTVALTPNEKLVARAIVNRERDKQKPPSMEDLEKAVGISGKDAKAAIEMLARLGILKRDKSVGGIGYVAAETRYVNWQPWLDFQFHKVTLSSGRTFSVN